MLRKLIGATVMALAASAAHADVGVLVFGKSHHFQTNGTKYNQTNLGAGLEWSPQDSNWLAGGFALKDSLSKVGGAAYVGYRVRHDLGAGWHVEATLRAGWLKDAKYNAPAVLPSIGVGYKNVTFEATYLPRVNGSAPVAVVWARINF